MATSLIDYERIETTVAKAKQLRRLADRLVTLGKEGTLQARRRCLAIVRKKSSVSKLFTTLAERFRDRQGGYTRILKLGYRLGDGAPMAIIEYLGFQPVKKEEAQGKKKKATSKEKEAAEAPEKKEKKAKAPKAEAKSKESKKKEKKSK
jgi:large subunit ribosomal protein L17